MGCGLKSGNEKVTGPAVGRSAWEPVTLRGVVIPATGGGEGSFRLACAGGAQYRIEASAGWKKTLVRHLWEEVRVVGLLNRSKKSILLQMLFPVGPSDSGLSMADFSVERIRRFVKEVFGNPGELVTAAAAFY
jgi:hypothetical protein